MFCSRGPSRVAIAVAAAARAGPGVDMRVEIRGGGPAAVPLMLRQRAILESVSQLRGQKTESGARVFGVWFVHLAARLCPLYIYN